MRKDSCLLHYDVTVRKISGILNSILKNFPVHIQFIEISCSYYLPFPFCSSPVEYKPDMSETDPKALFQQQIPKSFLDLQGTIRETVADCHMKRAPIMEEEEFR